MKELEASTKKGQAIIESCKRNQGYYLSEVYSRYSTDRENAWKWCEQQYLLSDRHSNFRITGHNSWVFSVAWECYFNDKRALRKETRDNTYIVYLDE